MFHLFLICATNAQEKILLQPYLDQMFIYKYKFIKKQLPSTCRFQAADTQYNINGTYAFTVKMNNLTIFLPSRKSKIIATASILINKLLGC